MIRIIGVALLSILLISCASTQQAPVIDRMPGKTAPKTAADKDWRPDLYTVKRGDTLYSIGLEHGYDYKEIAQANNIKPPYVIHVGQLLNLKQVKTAAATPIQTAPTPITESTGVVITPLDMGGTVESGTLDGSAIDATPSTSAAISNAPPLLNEPRALREPYSDQALNAPIVRAPIVQAKAEPATTATVIDTAKTPAPEKTQPEIIKPAATATAGDITWAWPTAGKVLTGFNEAGSARGIDIGGSTGQAVTAAAPGKVIYSGSDLRGYGKLVIVKHNTDFLSVYAHNSKILVKEGEQVVRGQKIAEMGNTDTDKTKLHFEIRRQGKSVDPAKYLPANPG